jgi:predicted SAM-dependent methyltransferase
MTTPLAKPPVTRKLDLAAGQSPKEGFEGVDLWPGSQHVVNLQRFPWPFEDESVAELHCSHYIEHIPMVYMENRVNSEHGSLHGGVGYRDALFAFFDECYRILIPGGWLTVQWPSHRSDRAFQDPTHRRFPTPQTMCYMNEQWRRTNKLDHYAVECNFGDERGNAVLASPIVDQSMQLRHPEAAEKLIHQQWNTTIDWVCRLQKHPRLPPLPST